MLAAYEATSDCLDILIDGTVLRFQATLLPCGGFAEKEPECYFQSSEFCLQRT